MQTSSDEYRKRRIGFALGVADGATMQCLQWIEDTKRIALGMHHYTTPRLHPGQWVRFIGDPHEVKGRDHGIPRLGSYGQVWRRCHLWNHWFYVVFLGGSRLFQLSAFELEPLVGPPIGRPRDHLRFVMRRSNARMRSLEASEGAH